VTGTLTLDAGPTLSKYGTSGLEITAADGIYLGPGGTHGYMSIVPITNTQVISTQRGTLFTMSITNTTALLPDHLSGISFCFYNLTGEDIYIDPQGGDTIHVLTNAAGDRVTNTTAGDILCLVSDSAHNWLVLCRRGTWTDAD